jgi:hypothetical protein
MSDYADEAEREVEAHESQARQVPSGFAPCTCPIVGEEHVPECHRCDVLGLPRPAGCRRGDRGKGA